ncbi:MAG: hypothetical protein KA104_02070 [Candidatus Pacebacteria bacterium]|nr:hypothetical protein [Candidatus Paceibacterota bacterium]
MTTQSDEASGPEDVFAWPIKYGRDSQTLGMLAAAQVMGFVIGAGKALGDKEPAWLWLSVLGLSTYLIMGGVIHWVNRAGSRFNIELSSEP